MESMFYIAEETRLFYTRLGSGPDVVLLHPTPLDHTFWLPVAERLAAGHRVTMPDLRGHGQSELGKGNNPSGDLSIERLGRDIVRLLDEAQIDQAIFAGCSIGSYVLYELWRQIPSRIKALGFCCGKPQPDSGQNRASRERNIERIEREGVSWFLDHSLDTLVSAAFRRREPARAAALRAMMDSMNEQKVIAVQKALMARPDSVPTLDTIRVPVLALAGSEDAASTPREMKTIPDKIPGAEYHLLVGAGHFAPYEDPETTASILNKFFSGI